MIDAQSIVVATVSTGQHGQEGRLRFVFWSGVALVIRLAGIAMPQSCLAPWIIPVK